MIANSEEMQAAITQVTIQEVTAVVTAMTEAKPTS